MNRNCKTSTSVGDILFGIGILAMLFILSLGIYLQAKTDSEQTKILKQQVTEQQYEKWKQCIDKSEGKDAECEKCDEIYNPDKTFIYKK